VTPDYRIDDHTLREVVDDQVAARSHVESLARLGPEGDHERVVWLRMLGELDAAERLGRAVLRRAGGATTTGGVASALRLAHVLHWRGRYRDADVLFDTARRTAERALAGREPTRRKWASAMIAFADQHQAKARFDEGRYDEAMDLAVRGLERRLADQAPDDQVASSRQAVATIRSRLAGDISPEGPGVRTQTSTRTATWNDERTVLARAPRAHDQKRNTMPAERFVTRLNEQIGHEFAAHQQYLAAAVYYDALTMPQTAGFFYRQAMEERGHAMMMVQYLLDQGEAVAIPGVTAPVTDFSDVVAPIRLALEQEQRVTEQINDLTKIARDEADFASDQFMQWFIKEQVEEVATMSDLLAVAFRSRENVELLEEYILREQQGEPDDPTAPPEAGAAG